jgi:hypothetical protein
MAVTMIYPEPNRGEHADNVLNPQTASPAMTSELA